MNGEKIKIDSLLYLKLWTKEPYIFYNSKTNLFIDKDVEINILNKVNDELSKAFRYNISYFIANKKGELCNINGYLPPIDFTYPDSIKNIPPPRPPLPEYPRNSGICKEILLVEIENSVVKFNDSICDYKNIIDNIETELKNKRKPIIFLYFNEKLSFEKYIKTIAEIKTLYYKYRNQFSQENYKSDYLDIDEDKQEEIRKIYPLRIKEIRINELNEIKKYAL